MKGDGMRECERKFTILVVDDNTAAAETMGRLLELRGHTTEVTYDGISALQNIKRMNPEVVLLDINLPDINGYEVVKRARGAGYTGCFVALTGYGMETDVRESLSMGCMAHLVKPVGVVDLEDCLIRITRANAVL